MKPDTCTDPTRISKLMSLILRHRPDEFGVQLDAAGFAEVEALLSALERVGHGVTLGALHEIVAASDKQRFALSEDGRRIRAQQGHSVPVDLGYAASEPPDRLYHGTVARALPGIRTRGLERGSRHHVHLSATHDVATDVGARRGAPVVLAIDARAMAAAGHVFLLTPNGVWLTDHVPSEFILPLEST